MGYDLVRLGWLQFERLCDLLGEGELGIGPAEWTGDADRGREMTVSGAVELGGIRLAGPVLVRVAFVRDTIAPPYLFELLAGPRPVPGLAQLVLTNRVLAPPEHAQVAKRAGPDAAVLDGAALGALIDARPALRRALPPLLGLREPPGLEVGDSTLDVEAALELARVFHPTPVHARALAVLAARSFAALTGPPEMGKTAVARMIALARLSEGWEAHECTSPTALWRHFDPARPQVFVADDAFGSTEYRPDTAERWARELPRILEALDDEHWLIWTSRPAPLRAGLARLQRERGLERFPAPAEVGVAADELAPLDRALLLFRHAREATLPSAARRLVQDQGAAIVAHPHFTPERIRRFVAGLPVAAREGLTGARAAVLGAAVEAALGRPTDAMRASFAALEPEHRALLHAMLDQPPGPVAERELAAALRRIAPGEHHDPHRLAEALQDHFLRGDELRQDWVHPSWRDVVVEELASDPAARAAFLRGCGPDGVALALSVGGGAAGERDVPLLRDDADFDALGDRLGPLLREQDEPGRARVLRALATVLRLRPHEARLSELVALADRALAVCGREWAGTVPSIDGLAAWHELAAAAPGPPGETPDAGHLWADLLPAGRVDLSDVEGVDAFADWLALVGVLAEHDRDRLRDYGWPGRQLAILGWLVDDTERAGDRAPPAVRERLGALLREATRLVPGLGAEGVAERADILREPPPAPLAAWTTPPAFDVAADVERILRDLD